MHFIPITAAEARGDSQPMRLACLTRLAMRGTDLLMAAARRARPRKRLTGDLILEAWVDTRSPWGALTIDLEAAQTVLRSDGYAVSTGGNVNTGAHAEVSPDASLADFSAAMITVASRTPLGQHLGVFYDADLERIDIDSVYLTDDRSEAIAIGTASHSLGGAYDFATGDAVWMPHLAESE